MSDTRATTTEAMPYSSIAGADPEYAAGLPALLAPTMLDELHRNWSVKNYLEM
jgi:hypothetical protein